MIEFKFWGGTPGLRSSLLPPYDQVASVGGIRTANTTTTIPAAVQQAHDQARIGRWLHSGNWGTGANSLQGS